jgi:hypothetical protein
METGGVLLPPVAFSSDAAAAAVVASIVAPSSLPVAAAPAVQAVAAVPAKAPAAAAAAAAAQSAAAQSANFSRTSPATVVWLHEHFEPADGMSLGRERLYAHYKDHCALRRFEPVNQASFGKLIRSIFPNLKTRRLGTRGNSKYHYDGIRVKVAVQPNQARRKKEG